jgi:hypothetical protein
VSNAECMYLVVLASTKLEGGSWSSVIPYAMRALTDYPQACQCVRGASTSAAFRAVAPSCAAQDTLELLRALETSCAFEPQIQASLSKALRGCSDADVVRSELVGVQLLDCLGAGGSELAGSSRLLNEGRIAQLANCVHDPDYSNPDCLALLGSLAKAAAQQPDSVEAQLVERMGKDGRGFCACVDAATKSAPAQAITPTCEAPYGSVQFLRNNKDKCEMIAAVPPSFWTATASAIAAAAAKATATSTTSTLSAATSTAGDASASASAAAASAAASDTAGEVPVDGQAVPVKGDGSWWDYLPDWDDLPHFPDTDSMLSWFAEEDAKQEARRLAAAAAAAAASSASSSSSSSSSKGAAEMGAGKAADHSNLRFKGNAARQSRASQQD